MQKTKLGIVIVSYNVKYFLEQCLHSVLKASNHLSVEIIVVDNNSADGSCAMVKAHFPNVKLVENKQNVGFSKANNQAITICGAEYILLLNPDTVVDETAFVKILNFMDANIDAGALGVKMIDGKGRFLPESKRGLPTPSASMYKMLGLSKLFPKSKRFGKYHLSYLSPDETSEVEILSGAFMLLRNNVLKQIGLLDERFFMYGEDIDLSYRIIKAGFKNYYFSETTIIHYKGESTKKASFNYVKVFYHAMILFAEKHYAGHYSKLFVLMIHFAVYLTASFSLIKRFILSILWPLVDLVLSFGIYYWCASYWEVHKFGNGGYFPTLAKFGLLILFSVLNLINLVFSRGYGKQTDFYKLLRNFSFLLVFELAIYSLLPETARFSRFVVIVGALGSSLMLVLLRIAKFWVAIKRIEFDLRPSNRIAIVGAAKEVERIKKLLFESSVKHKIVGCVNINSEFENSTTEILGEIGQLSEICRLNKIDEIIFSSKDLSSEAIIQNMLKMVGLPISFKIAPPESFSIIGSNSIHTSGQLYTIDFNSIGKEANRRKKRLLDIFLSIAILIILPFKLLGGTAHLKMYVFCLKVLLNQLTWVGYDTNLGLNTIDELPKIKPSVFFISLKRSLGLKTNDIHQININYARDYKIFDDLKLVLRQIFMQKKRN